MRVVRSGPERFALTCPGVTPPPRTSTTFCRRVPGGVAPGLSIRGDAVVIPSAWKASPALPATSPRQSLAAAQDRASRTHPLCACCRRALAMIVT